ncbi:MAG: thermonuclease family protein [Bdellovibrionales bacterium]|nr:thermonuclease family protein [Bdellovibrionales bacterium]
MILLILQFALAISCDHDAHNFRCVKVIKNYDGDTITVNIPKIHPLLGEKVSVRVRGIDTAEVKGKAPCEKDAARTARNLVGSLTKNAKTVDLLNVERDKYFRILADVMVDGKSIKDILLKNQLAVVYDGGTKAKVNWCEYLRKPASK